MYPVSVGLGEGIVPRTSRIGTKLCRWITAEIGTRRLRVPQKHNPSLLRRSSCQETEVLFPRLFHYFVFYVTFPRPFETLNFVSLLTSFLHSVPQSGRGGSSYQRTGPPTRPVELEE